MALTRHMKWFLAVLVVTRLPTREAFLLIDGSRLRSSDDLDAPRPPD